MSFPSKQQCCSCKCKEDFGGRPMRIKDLTAKPTLIFGFLGLGEMGRNIVINLLKANHKVTIWNHTMPNCDEFLSLGATIAMNPDFVVQVSDITFSCMSHTAAAHDVLFGNSGVMSAMKSGKSYVELTTIDSDTSKIFADAIRKAGGRYLEAQLQGSPGEAKEGQLTIIAAGDPLVYNDCESCFKVMSERAFHLGETGNACRINAVINSYKLTSYTFIEGLVGLAKSLPDVSPGVVMEILESIKIVAPDLVDTGLAIINRPRLTFAQVDGNF